MTALTPDQIGDIEFALRSRDWRTELSRCDRDALLVLISAARANAKLVEALKEAREWLDASLMLVRGEGPPNWDRIREAIKECDAALGAAGVKP